MNKLLVIGGASFDTLHLRDQTVTTVGGAGVYTAMAARRCGTAVSIFGARPLPCPAWLEPVAERVDEWFGPVIAPEKMLRFEILYAQGRTEYLQAELSADKLLSPALLPPDLSPYDIVHVTPVGDTAVQRRFIRACRERGARRISAGTGLFIAAEQPELVRLAIAETDLFFMNELEATAVFGSVEAACTAPGKLLFVTLGAQGARVIQGETVTRIPAAPGPRLDPTGAGDTFCGAALAFMIGHEHPIMAARRAAALAAQMIGQVGPAALLLDEPPPEIAVDGRVRVNEEQVARIAALIATLPEAAPFPFTSPELPPVGDPRALDYFFAATLQQFSFWSAQDGRYHLPLIATIGGTTLKGSDYLWEAYRRGLVQDPDFCSPRRQAGLSRAEMARLFRADDGSDPMPALDLHLQMANSYGRDMAALELTPRRVLDMALDSAEPLQTFIELLDQIGGYKEDPLRKKSSLLAMILNQRPEEFLPLRPDEEIAPVVDYHALRSSLRIGLVDIIDPELAAKIRGREIVTPEEEWAVRYAAYLSNQALVVQSGKSTGAVDWFLFSARRRCPEMTEPECAICPVDEVCAKRKPLFQPVIRTSFY